MTCLSEAPSWQVASLLADGSYRVFKSYVKWIEENADDLQEAGAIPSHGILLVGNLMRTVVGNLIEAGEDIECVKAVLEKEIRQISYIVE